MLLKDVLLWAKEWNLFHRSSPKYRGAAKYRRMTIDKLNYHAKKDMKNGR